jgi:hypothetical protein
LKKGSSDTAVTVTGTALDQKVEGTGSIEGDRLTLRLTLQVKRLELKVDLAMPREEYEFEADRMRGTAADAQGTERAVELTRKATDLEGTWREGSESSLSFAEPVLDWHDGKLQVRMDVTGYIFGRPGKGNVESWGRNLTGGFKATDYSHHNQYLDAHLWDADYEKSYRRDCPKEGWWASDRLFLSLEMCRDGSFLAGTVKPNDGRQIEAHVQLARSIGGSSRRAMRSYL